MRVSETPGYCKVEGMRKTSDPDLVMAKGDAGRARREWHRGRAVCMFLGEIWRAVCLFRGKMWKQYRMQKFLPVVPPTQ